MRFITVNSRHLRLAAASLASATALLTLAPGAAHAHHGFDDYDTGRLYYISGTVSDVRWGEPHSYFTVTVDSDMPTDTPERDLPEQLQAPEDSGPIDAAPSYSGSHDALAVTIAPPSFTGMWGLDRPLEDGERVEAVGYVGESHDDEFRPVVFWFEDGNPVNQVLGSELPATPLPTPYPERDAPAASSSGDDQAAPTASGSDTTSPATIWAGLGAALVAVVAGGAVYLRARSRRE